jgi:hypothetical protein
MLEVRIIELLNRYPEPDSLLRRRGGLVYDCVGLRRMIDLVNQRLFTVRERASSGCSDESARLRPARQAELHEIEAAFKYESPTID